MNIYVFLLLWDMFALLACRLSSVSTPGWVEGRVGAVIEDLT